MNTLDKMITNVKPSKALKQNTQTPPPSHLKPEIEKELGESISDYHTGKNVLLKLQSTQAITDHLTSL